MIPWSLVTFVLGLLGGFVLGLFVFVQVYQPELDEIQERRRE